jgi:hypothetical protein
MGTMKFEAIALVLGLLISVAWVSMRFGYIVFDRCVFDFQINPVLDSGVINNLREYDIVHQYVEMKFEENPDDFERDADINKLDSMMGRYREKNP